MRPNLSVPPFLGDLFRDLRDRRLLPVAAVLAIAILAVPFALSKSEPAPSPSAPAPHATADGSTFAVVADDPGLRDYHRRLRGDSPKDPFTQQFATSGGGGSAAGGGGDGSAAAGGGAGSGSDQTGGGQTTGTGGDGSQPAPSGGGSEPAQPDQGESEPAYVLHLRVGPPDEMKPRDLSAPAPLPDLDNPVIVFQRLGSEGHSAIFRVDESVSAIYGDAKCLEGTDRCELVEIEPGFPVMFVYGDPERSLMLKVVRIEHNR